MSIARFSVRNPVTSNLLMWGIVAAGLYAALNLRKEMFPNVDPEAIAVTVEFPGATPEEVERLVVRRIERELDGIDDVDEITSQVFEGLCSIRIETEEGADRDRVLSDVRSAIDEVKPDLPEDAEEPDIRQVRPILPVISVVVYGDVAEARLREAARKVRDDLLDLDTISEVTLNGVRDREIWIEIRPEKLEEHGLTFAEVGLVLQRSNLDLPAGQLKGERGNIRVRTLGETDRVADIAAMLVKSLPGGAAVRVRDLGEVKETFADVVERGRYQGKRAAMVTVWKTPEEDAVEIATTVKDFVASGRAAKYGDVALASTRDLSRFISQRLDLMTRNARLGILLVVIVLGIFLELRVAFWVAVGLAISFLGTFLLMQIFGATINLISMFGLIVVLGLLVDDAIVIGENVFTRRRQGLDGPDAAIRGTEDVAAPVTTAVFTTMIAFAPLAFLGGRVGTFLGVLPLVVISALAVSLVEAFIILPSHLAHAPKPGRKDWLPGLARLRRRVLEERLPDLFERVLRVVLRWRYVTLAVTIAIAMSVAGILVGGHLPFVFLGAVDAETVMVDLEMAPGTSEDETIEVLARLETVALSYDEIASAYTVVGMTMQDGRRVNVADPSTVGQITIEMKPAEERTRRTQAVVNDMRREVGRIAGVRRLVIQPVQGGPGGSDVEIRVRGKDLAAVGRATDWVRELVGGYEGVTEVYDDLVEGKLELRYSLRDEARSLGLTTRDLALQIRHALFGFEVQDLQDEDEEVTVRVLLPESERRRIEDLSRLRIATERGGRVPLEEVARLETDRGYATLTRVDGRRAFTVFASVDEEVANVAQINTSLERRLGEMATRFPGVTYAFEGSKQDTRDSLAALRVGFPAALLAIYALVAILFRSYTQPFLVMAAIPFAIIGVVFGHLLMGYPMTLLSLIGTVALAGIVVNDSLILVDVVNRKRRDRGMAVFEAVLQGSRARLRAILLTSVTTIAGLGPLMLERSFQAQFLIPMAISIVFGLAFATVLVLVVIPTLYLVLEDIRATLRWIWSGGSGRFVRDS